MINLFLKINIFVFILSLLSLSIGQENKITVDGTIIDSITGEPIPNVLIIFTDKISDLMNMDISSILQNGQRTLSDNSGKFSAEITVSQSSFLLAGFFGKGNYQVQAKTAMILSNKASFGTIKMRKEEFRTVQVSGIVKDSLTGRPVSGASVILTNTTIIIDSVYHTLTTDDQGRFSKEMKIGKGGDIPPYIIYLVAKEGYDSLGNMVPDDGKSQIDLGTISIKMNSAVPIKNISTNKNILSRPSLVRIYSINGKLLYSGTESNIVLLHKKGVLSSGPVVIKYQHPYLNPRERLYNFIE